MARGANPLSQAKSNLTSIQSMRGLAALGVAAGHLHSVELKFDPSPLLGSWAVVGLGGVDLFFVISGFVMVWVTRASQGMISAVPNFWLARVIRIYPLWWLVLSAIFALWLLKPEWVYSSNTVPPDILRSYLLFPAQGLPLHAVGWTLIHEMWFYVVFGFILMAPSRFLPALLVLWTAFVVIGALLSPKASDPVWNLIRHPLTLEFIAGAAIGLIATQRSLPFARPLLYAGCFWLLLAALSIRDNPPAAFADEWARIWLCGIPFALILWGWVGLEQDGGESAKWSQALGNWSYALYLIHVPVFALIGRLAKPVSQPGPLDNVAVIVVAFGAAILAAFILHNSVERPIQKFAQKWLKRPDRLT
jgi:exopolysaccharide production protein ExoZ